MVSAPSTIRFDRFTLDSRRREVLAEGQALAIQKRAFDILEYLVHNRVRPVSRDEILQSVFRDVTVLPSNVAVQIHALRSAFRKAGCVDELILTLNQQRYQFIGTVLPEVAGAAGMNSVPMLGKAVAAARAWPGVRPLRLVAAAMVAAVVGLLTLQGRAWFTPATQAPRLSIMVLPFVNRSTDSRQDYRVDALTDELIAQLARIPGSTVIARETADIYRTRHLAAHEIGAALHVRYLLDGSVQPDDTALHITASLIDTEHDTQVWSTAFSIPRGQIGDARDAIVGRIAAALDVKLIQQESDRAMRDRSGPPDALDLFYRARSILDRHAALADYQSAQALLEQATATQRDFVDAFAELGWIIAMKVTEVDDPDTPADVAEARAAIAHALALSPNNPRALAAQGRFFSIDGNYNEAIASARAALAAEPGRADALLVLAYAQYYWGHLDDAVPPLQAMLRINPEGAASKLPYQRLGVILVLQGHPEAAIEALNRSLAGEAPPEPGAGTFGRQEKSRLLIIAANEMLGRDAQAKAMYADFALRWPRRTAWRIGAMSPRLLTSLPGFSRFLDALVAAGMPMFADEHEDARMPPSPVPLSGDEFAMTPLLVPQARTIDTAGLAALLRDTRPTLVIDVGTGTLAVPGATWVELANRAAGDNGFADSAAVAFASAHPGRPIVVMSDGTWDIESYNVALHLASEGYRQIFWYRGGEEGWAKAGLHGEYLRKD